MATQKAVKIDGLNVNFPGTIYPLDADKYGVMKRAMLATLPPSNPGMTISDLKAGILPEIEGPLFPGGDKAGWWIKAVQLDLEARGAIVREPVSPIRLHRA